MNTTRLPMASLWRTKRRSTIRHWLRASTVNSRSGPTGGAGTPSASSIGTSSCAPVPVACRNVCIGPGRFEKSVNADPRVEVGIGDVGQDVEDDHHGGG